MMRLLLSFMFSCFLGLWPFIAHAKSTPLTWIKADDPRLHYIGRIDFSSKQQPRFIWQASEVNAQLTGQTLYIGFSHLKGQVFFNLSHGDHTQVIQARNGWQKVTLKNPKKQPFKLFKRTEADAGEVAFLGLKIAKNTQLEAEPTAPPKRKFMFLGDSITVGACNEDGLEDQWENKRTHNSALSYAALVSQSLNADHQNISVSGMGIITGYVPYPVAHVWNKMRYSPTAKIADLTQFIPNIIFINYGENDDSFTTRQQQPFPAQFVSEYLTFIKNLRQHYPNSLIVLLRGGMFGGAQSSRLIAAWQTVVQAATQQDTNLKAYAFKHWAKTHPRVADHQKMADELITWLKDQSI